MLEHDRDVELAGRQTTEGGSTVDEVVLDHEPGVAVPQEHADLRGQVDERVEERPEADTAAAQARQLGDLLLGGGDAAEDLAGVLGEHPPGLRRVDALARPPHELRPELLLEQGDLAGDGGLRERQRRTRARERSVLNHRPQGGELDHVQPVALAPGLAWLCLALAAMAAANSVIDVAMNVQGIALERRLGHPALSGLHAAHSFGVLGGGLAGMGAAGAGLAPLAHFGAIAAVAALAPPATRPLIEDREPRGDGRPARPNARLALLGLLAFCALLCEGGANDWSAIHLRSERDAGETLAAGAFVAFSLALALGRLAGDRIVGLAGRAGAVRGAAIVAAVGLGLAIVTSAPLPTILGWALFGAGISLIAPTVIGAAPGSPRPPHPWRSAP